MLGNKLLEKHEDVALENFDNFVKEGNKLSMGELKKLKDNWKSVYISAQMMECKQVNNYVHDVQDKIEDNG